MHTLLALTINFLENPASTSRFHGVAVNTVGFDHSENLIALILLKLPTNEGSTPSETSILMQITTFDYYV